MSPDERAKLWLGKLTKLNPNQARPGSACRGKAPHKPLLLLCFWSLDDNLRIVVSTKKFTEHGPEAIRLSSLAGRHLQFDPAAKLRPGINGLRQHRMHFGLRA